MTDLTFLTQYIDLVTLGICLCIGYVFKQAFSWFSNKYIPLAMLCLGTAIAIANNFQNINASVLLGGMISGLASTGLYEMLRNLLNSKSNSEGE